MHHLGLAPVGGDNHIPIYRRGERSTERSSVLFKILKTSDGEMGV